MRAVQKFWSILSIGLLAAVICASPVAAGAPGAGSPAPGLIVAQLDGRQFDLAALRGRVVIVSFWATWCPPCRAEMPALDAYYRAHRAEGLELIGLSEDRPHDRADVLTVMKAFSYPAAMLDTARVNGFGSFRILPVTYVIDRRGVVRALFGARGKPVTAESLNEAITPLLSDRH